MPWQLPDSLEMLLWPAAGLVAVWLCLPMLAMILGLSRVGCRIVGGPETLTPTGDDPQYDELFDQLRDLGFEPLGSRVEFGWLFNQHYYKQFPPGRVFASTTGDCFVSLYRIFPGEPWRLSYHTVFTDGSLVSTANQMPQLRIEQEGYFRWGRATPDLAELLRLHREVAENYRAERGLTIDSPGLEGFCATNARHSERHLRRQGPRMGLNALVQPAVFVGVLTLAAGYYDSFGRWTVPAAFILSAIAYRVLLPLAARDTARRMWNEDQAKGLAEQWARQRRIQRGGGASGRPTPPRF
jgi:hypothetical protein